jgi:hypothetical protein
MVVVEFRVYLVLSGLVWFFPSRCGKPFSKREGGNAYIHTRCLLKQWDGSSANKCITSDQVLERGLGARFGLENQAWNGMGWNGIDFWSFLVTSYYLIRICCSTFIPGLLGLELLTHA